nr:hypothetical protein CFP56_10589 [Quercus suber]
MYCNFQKPFRFEQMWLTDKGCSDTVEAVWSMNSTAPWDTRVLRKLESCGAALTKWSKKSFGSVKKQLESARKQLKAAEKYAIRSGDSSRMRLLEDEQEDVVHALFLCPALQPVWRKVITEGYCDVCKLQQEDVVHALFLCPALQPVWR